MRPTIGRIVHYFADATDEAYGIGPVAPAIIVAVSADGIFCDLQVFCTTAHGSLHRRHVEEGGKPGQWRWPPREHSR